MIPTMNVDLAWRMAWDAGMIAAEERRLHGQAMDGMDEIFRRQAVLYVHICFAEKSGQPHREARMARAGWERFRAWSACGYFPMPLRPYYKARAMPLINPRLVEDFRTANPAGPSEPRASA